MAEVKETPKLPEGFSKAVSKAIPETIPVDAKLISMIQEHDRLFHLIWGDDKQQHPEMFMDEWEEQSLKIIEYVRRKMGLPHHVRDQ